MHPSVPAPASPAGVPFREAVRVWCRVAVLSFGGPAGQIAVMQRILVDEKRWVSPERFLHALNYCMLLPGPEAQQLATYVGWLLHRTWGGILAGTLFVLPGFLSILGLSVLYAEYRDLALVAAVLYGLKPAVVAVVVEALIRIGRRAVHGRAGLGLAAGAFVAIFFFQVPFPVIVLVAGSIGYLLGRSRSGGPASASEATSVPLPAADEAAVARARPSWRRSAVVAAAWLAVWWLPVAGLALALGAESVYASEALFFSKTAVVTFGGAYAVLAYVAQRAVEDFGWLAPGEMLDGLGMAETTPGPLIQVVQFVAFLGAYRNPGGFDPLAAGVIGSVVATWVTFVPCFLWIFLGAPYVEWLRGRRGLAGALSAITAAVVGVILNLAVWFSLHTLFGEVRELRGGFARLLVPEWSSVDFAALGIAAGAFVCLFRLRLGMIPTLLLAVVAGVLVRSLATAW